MKSALVGLLAVATVGGVGYWYWARSDSRQAEFRTEPVERGDLVVTIGATGTLEPEEVVDVGAQVAGIIKEFGQEPSSAKLIDYGSAVEPGTVLARIDEAIYVEEVNLARAGVAKAQALHEQRKSAVVQAGADVQRAEADLGQLRAKLYQAERDWARAQKLKTTNVITDAEYDTFQAAHETAKAALAVGEAAVNQARAALETAKGAVQEAAAEVNSAQALLKKAETNLGYTTITSPIGGVIIDRRVNIGQTVVASLNAPSLFLIAKDLTRMQVWASVNEADIGRIKPGQKVRFTVDSYPGERFTGEVAQIRLNASMTQNVVTYTVVVAADNSQGKLLPYLTANLRFEIERRDNVLLVPSQALRWKPKPEQVQPEFRSLLVEPPRRRGAVPSEAESAARRTRGTVWVEEPGGLRPVTIGLGATDGVSTEVASGELPEGAKVVVGEVRQEKIETTVNPFAPSMTGGRPP